MPRHLFFYGTLMAGFGLRHEAGIDERLRFLGRGWIRGALFDLGSYPAAVPAPEGQVWGEVYETTEPVAVLAVLDSLEGYRPEQPEQSLYTRDAIAVTLADGAGVTAWVYFYLPPLGGARRIESGDYRRYLTQQ